MNEPPHIDDQRPVYCACGCITLAECVCEVQDGCLVYRCLVCGKVVFKIKLMED